MINLLKHCCEYSFEKKAILFHHEKLHIGERVTRRRAIPFSTEYFDCIVTLLSC